MTAAGFGAADRVKIAGDSMTGTLNLAGSPPLTVPSGTSGYVLTSDGSGNLNLAPAAGGGGGVTLTPTAVKTANYTTAAGEFVPCDTQTAGAFTLTLPNAPADKSVVGAKLVRQTGTNAVTIACAGSDVFNVSAGATSRTLSLLNQGVLLQYKASGAIWYVMDDSISLTQLDARYLPLAGGTVSGNLAVTGTATVGAFRMTAGATNNYVLTSDGSGNGAWEVAPGAGSGMSNPMTALGDTIFEDATPAAARLAGNTTTTRKFMRQTGNGTISAAPAWDTLTNGDLPSGAALLAGAAFTGNVSTTGTLAVTGNSTASGTLAVAKAATSGVFALADAATITVDASKGNTFRVTLGGNRTMGTPSNPADGQMILFEVTQDLTGSRTLAWSGAYLFTTALPAPALTATAGYTDVIGFKYRLSSNVWRCLAISQGYSS